MSRLEKLRERIARNPKNVTKEMEYYLGLPYRIEIYPEPDGSGYTAAIPDLPGCLTCADTLQELVEMVEDAKRTWIELSLEDGLTIPEPSPFPFDEEPVYIPISLHNRLAERARRENIPLNQLVVAILEKAVGQD
ncbi:MAG: type II toxin-antitoxin system HicB family antitoxin [Anaerolineae bacterium]